MSQPSQDSEVQCVLDNIAVENFREYLQIPSVQPDHVYYERCLEFLIIQAKNIGLSINTYISEKIVIFTWEGTQPTKPSILLNSRMSVLPVYEDNWTYPPFSAHMDEQGNIYARGSQYMKCIGIQYLEAIRRLNLNGQRCERTIHVSFIPNETIGTKDFVHAEGFKGLNIGFALNEGSPCPYEKFYMFSGKKSIWHVIIKCVGNFDHGSIMSDNTAAEKLRVIIDRFMDFRASEKARLCTDPKQLITFDEVTSVNLTKIWGGVQANVIPTELNALFNICLPSSDHEKFEATIKRWCEEAGPDVTYSFKRKISKENTELNDSNPFWIAFKNTCDEIGVELDICYGRSRFIREINIPAIGFSPTNKTKILPHDHDEYLNKDIFLKGIEIYTKLIPAIANV